MHGNNRLGDNSLLDCVVFGRVVTARDSLFSDSKPVPGLYAAGETARGLEIDENSALKAAANPDGGPYPAYPSDKSSI